MAEPQSHIEVPATALDSYAPHFREVVETVCASRFFKPSPKSCEFLRHIVHRTLEGNTSELKERLIGMSLFGRVATYDTGSDATVRVRANDVRKRLTAYNEAHRDSDASCLELPAGSYVPRFYRAANSIDIPEAVNVAEAIAPVPSVQLPPQLSLQQLATPTLCALFLCVMFLRWQVAQEHPYNAFWQGVFRDGHVSLYLPPTEGAAAQPSLRFQQVQMSSPLFNLAGQFHSQIALVEKPLSVDGGLLIVVDGPPSHHRDVQGVPAQEGLTEGRLTVEDTPEGAKILDHNNPGAHSPVIESAALLTVENIPHRRIEIEGTDDAAIQNAVRVISERDAFPEILADNRQPDGTTQLVLPTDPRDQPIVFHDGSIQAGAR